ncbi:MAG: hypothetical protein ACE5EH_11980 [Gammaproteobacteria bacterium]
MSSSCSELHKIVTDYWRYCSRSFRELLSRITISNFNIALSQGILVVLVFCSAGSSPVHAGNVFINRSDTTNSTIINNGGSASIGGIIIDGQEVSRSQSDDQIISGSGVPAFIKSHLSPFHSITVNVAADLNILIDAESSVEVRGDDNLIVSAKQTTPF